LIAANKLHEGELARRWLPTDPENAAAKLEPVCKVVLVEDPLKGMVKLVLDLVDPGA
jgi:hypothetical protein